MLNPLIPYAIKRAIWYQGEGNTIVVSSPEVTLPIAVRYAWAGNPICNLYNGVDLPASPFRTDDWK